MSQAYLNIDRTFRFINPHGVEVDVGLQTAIDYIGHYAMEYLGEVFTEYEVVQEERKNRKGETEYVEKRKPTKQWIDKDSYPDNPFADVEHIKVHGVNETREMTVTDSKSFSRMKKRSSLDQGQNPNG